MKNKQRQSNSGEKQVEAINEHWKEIVKSNKNVDEDVEKKQQTIWKTRR